jgi:hypothetical protein
MTSLGFENYAEALKIYLARYREVSFRIFYPCTNSPFLSHSTRNHFKNKRRITEFFTDWYLETLLATQKSGAPAPGGPNAGADGSSTGPYGTADNGLLGGNGLDESYDPAFAGAVHNGNGSADY